MRKQLIQQYISYHKDKPIEALFMFQSATVWPSTENVYKECIRDKRFHVTLALCEDVVVEKGHLTNARKFLKKNNIAYIELEDLDFDTYIPHIVFIQLPYDTACHTPQTLSLQFKRRGSRVIYLPYGNEISNSEVARRDQCESFVVENCWRMYVGNETMLAEYRKYCRNRAAVRCFGASKFDSIYHRESYPLDKDIVHKAQGRKIIVWKIHFPKKDVTSDGMHLVTPELDVYLEFLNHIRLFSDMFFVVLPHPKLLNIDVAALAYRDDIQMKKIREFFSKCEHQENVYVDISSDYRNSLYNADAIMMDRSGLVIEAALLNIPVLFLQNDAYQESYMSYMQEICKTYKSGTKCCDMVDFLEDVRNERDELAELRKSIVNKYFPYVDGNCSKRILEDIVVSLNQKVEKPRVIFYGSGSICDYYMNVQEWKNGNKFEIVGIADSNELRWGTLYFGHKILSPNHLISLDYDAIVITTEMFYYDIKKFLVYEMFLDERKIYRLDEFVLEIEEW